MRSDKAPANANVRQKATIGVIVIVLAIIGWQLKGLFGGGSSAPAPVAAAGKPAMAAGGAASGAPQTPPPPQPASISAAQAAAPLTEREKELIQLQQATEAKYLSAVNELQMLKIQRDIAETNKAIMAARLDTVTAEKGIVDLLSKPVVQMSPAQYAEGLANPGGGAAGAAHQPTTAPAQQQVAYTVISVSELHYKWGAVVGSAGSLYNVAVGDVLPPDSSTVVAIDKTGVVIEKDGVKKKISLVPII